MFYSKPVKIAFYMKNMPFLSKTLITYSLSFI